MARVRDLRPVAGSQEDAIPMSIPTAEPMAPTAGRERVTGDITYHRLPSRLAVTVLTRPLTARC